MKILRVSIAFLLLATAVSAQLAHLAFTSDPGDFIGQGQTRDILYTPANSIVFSAQVRREVAAQPAELDFVLGDFTPALPFSTLFFGTDALGIPMQPGTYLGAQRADFAAPGHPGLDISFDHRGSNTLTGFFVVSDFQFSLGAVQHFLAAFEQHSEGAIPAMRGTFEYSSAAFLSSVPEPSTYSLLAVLFLIACVALHKRVSARAKLRGNKMKS